VKIAWELSFGHFFEERSLKWGEGEVTEYFEWSTHHRIKIFKEGCIFLIVNIKGLLAAVAHDFVCWKVVYSPSPSLLRCVFDLADCMRKCPFPFIIRGKNYLRENCHEHVRFRETLFFSEFYRKNTPKNMEIGWRWECYIHNGVWVFCPPTICHCNISLPVDIYFFSLLQCFHYLFLYDIIV